MAKYLDSKVTISAGNTYIELLALHAEVLGMQAENEWRRTNGDAIAYGDEAFFKVAEQMRLLKEETNAVE